MSKILLIAEDSKTIKKAIELTFSNDKEIELFFVEDGQTALMKAKEINPGVVLVDHKLAGLDGYDLLAVMKQESGLSRIPVIIMHSYHKSFDDVRGVGAEAHIAKPFLTEELINMVNSAFESKLTSQEESAEQEIIIDAEYPDSVESGSGFDLGFDSMGQTNNDVPKPASIPAPVISKAPEPSKPPVAPVSAKPFMAPKSPGPSMPAKPSVPARPSMPAKPSVPARPSMPAKPSVPARPSMPAKPSVPARPSMPPKPSVPARPSMPAKPSVPARPSMPAKPSVPARPSMPAKPSVPVKPSMPAKPSVPVKPSMPPMAPAANIASPKPSMPPIAPATSSVPARPSMPPVAPISPEKTKSIGVSDSETSPIISSTVLKKKQSADVKSPAQQSSMPSKGQTVFLSSYKPEDIGIPVKSPKPEEKSDKKELVESKTVSEVVKTSVDKVVGDNPQYQAIEGLSREIIEKIAWEVVPQLAEVIIKEILKKDKRF